MTSNFLLMQSLLKFEFEHPHDIQHYLMLQKFPLNFPSILLSDNEQFPNTLHTTTGYNITCNAHYVTSS